MISTSLLKGLLQHIHSVTRAIDRYFLMLVFGIAVFPKLKHNLFGIINIITLMSHFSFEFYCFPSLSLNRIYLKVNFNRLWDSVSSVVCGMS
ncbi:hypothetical protein D3C73_1459630 [compost metagenome]